jgi:aquaporin Z
MDARKYLAELVGTFILVVVPFGFGLGLLAAIQSAGYVSGGHFNPAVTVGALLDRRIDVMNAVGYIVAQVIGAIAASGVVLLVASQEAVKSTASGYPPDKMVNAFAVEALLTAVFLLVILTVTKRAPNHAAFAIPLTLTVFHFAGIPFSGASVNPARSLAPALVGGTLDSTIIVWIAGPIVGAIVGWAIYRALEDGSTR